MLTLEARLGYSQDRAVYTYARADGQSFEHVSDGRWGFVHGSASLPQYDGYASDLTYPGQRKRYFYPNCQEARTLWYHDHALGMTRLNVYAGPAGFYTAEALAKAYGDQARIDIIDRYPVPYGLIRFGVAPDHQSLKAVAKRYDKVAESDGVGFIGNVCVGEHVSIGELLDHYDAVVLATGAPRDRELGIPGEDLPGVIGSAEFVGWYNGHPDFADLSPSLGGTHAAVIGNGNVALDCARILSKTRAEFEGSDIVGRALDALERANIRHVTILGRRGPHDLGLE